MCQVDFLVEYKLIKDALFIKFLLRIKNQKVVFYNLLIRIISELNYFNFQFSLNILKTNPLLLLHSGITFKLN